MVASKAATPETKQPPIPPIAIVVGLVLVAGLACVLYLNHAASKQPLGPPPLTGPAKAYVRSLKLSDVQMQAHESYLKQQVVEITGNIENKGDRVLEVVQINCVFTDPYGQVVLRERVAIVSKKMGKLAPGEIKNFRLAFDNVPADWNQAMPSMVIANIEFS